MTNVRFDKRVRWRPVSAWLADDDQRVYAAPDTHLVTLVLSTTVVAQIVDIPYSLHGGTFDCNIVNVSQANKPEEVLPRFAGYDYMRITLLDYANPDEPHTTLSRLLDEAPSEETVQQMRPKLVQGLTPVTLRLPKVLLDTLDKGAARNQMDRNTYLWDVLMEHAVDLL